MDSCDSIPHVAGIVLAGGISRRFGRKNKLLLPFRGEPVVRRVVSSYVLASLDPVFVVVGHDAALVEDALHGLPIVTVQNGEYGRGQSTSLVRGVRELPPSANAAVIGVADQPLLTAGVVQLLVSTWAAGKALLVAPRYGGRRGNPVLFDRRLFGDLLSVEGDLGGREIVHRHAAKAAWIEVQDEIVGADIDTEADYRRLVAD